MKGMPEQLPDDMQVKEYALSKSNKLMAVLVLHLSKPLVLNILKI